MDEGLLPMPNAAEAYRLEKIHSKNIQSSKQCFKRASRSMWCGLVQDMAVFLATTGRLVYQGISARQGHMIQGLCLAPRALTIPKGWGNRNRTA